MARNVQVFFFTHQIELLPCPACYLNLSPVKNVWSILAQRLARDTPPTATPDQLWLNVEASCTTVPQSLFDSIQRRVVVVIANNGDYINY
ncbi:transposable element Tcb1 transposase [Trichonephila clavipes]|nr:transposable element Tcb1 transposase [Trichonephila clavipes]